MHLSVAEQMKEHEVGRTCSMHGWEKRTLGRPRHRWKDIRLNLRETRWVCVDWIHMAQDKDQWQALVDTVMNLLVPYRAGNFLIS